MELRHLRYFVTVAEELHFTRAAARLHIAQPPLSQQIRQLETELGVQLLVRSKRKVQLTEAGELFLGKARKVLADFEEARQAAKRAGRGEIGRLAVGFVASAAYDVLPETVQAYRSRFPDVEVELRELDTAAQLRELAAERLDVGLVHATAVDDRLMFEIVREDPMVAALPSSHPLANRRQIAVRDLAGAPFVLPPGGQSAGYTELVTGVCQRAGFSPRVVLTAREVWTLMGLVAAGAGVSLLPGAAQQIRIPGVVCRPLSGPRAILAMAVAYRRDAASPLLTWFLETARAVAAGERGTSAGAST